MIELEKLPDLPPPYEIFEFEPCRPAYFRITEWKLGKMTITPRFPGAPPTKVVEAIRLFVDPATKRFYPPWYDLTPRRLVYQLAGMLAQGVPEGMWLKVHRDIPGPRAHFSVEWVAAPE